MIYKKVMSSVEYANEANKIAHSAENLYKLGSRHSPRALRFEVDLYSPASAAGRLSYSQVGRPTSGPGAEFTRPWKYSHQDTQVPISHSLWLFEGKRSEVRKVRQVRPGASRIHHKQQS